MRFGLRTLLLVLALAPPMLAGAYWLATRSSDFLNCLAAVLVGLTLGLAIALPIFWFRRPLRERLSGITIAMPWWFFAGGAIMFLAFAWATANRERYTFATLFGAMATMQVIAMLLALFNKNALRTSRSSDS